MRPKGILAAAVVLACGWLLAACAHDDATSGYQPGGAAVGAGPVARPAAAAPRYHYIVVQPGQSLGRIAEAHHVAMHAIIAANQLTPPYELKAGARLAIPVGADAAPPHAVAHATPAHPAHAAVASATPPRAAPEIIPLDDPPPRRTAAAGKPTASAASSPPAAARRAGGAREEIPLDGPPPATSR